jgi:hypothetical protein
MEPAEQSVQLPAPSWDVIVPALQSKQLEDVLELYLPTTQFEHICDAFIEYLPALHEEQVVALVTLSV